MKKNIKLTLSTIMVLWMCSSLAQTKTNFWKVNDTTDYFNDPHCPFTNSLTQWFLRQKFNLDVYQANFQIEFPLEKTLNYESGILKLETFLPLFKKGKLSSNIGTSYSKNIIQSQNDSLKRALHELAYLWFGLDYKYKKWKFMLVNELFMRGDNNSLYSQTGNHILSVAVAAYAINTKWHLILLGGYQGTFMENGKKEIVYPGIQARYEPTNRFKIVFGMPVVLAFEWNFLPKFDFAFNQFMFEETESYLRYRATDWLSISCFYRKSALGTDTYFHTDNIILEQEQFNFNQVIQNKHNISLQLGFKTLKDIGFILIGGYYIGDEIKLYNNEVYLGAISGNNKIFVGFHVQYLKYF